MKKLFQLLRSLSKSKECEHSHSRKIQDGMNEICANCGILLCWMCHEGIPGFEKNKPTQRTVCSSYCHKEMRIHYL